MKAFEWIKQYLRDTANLSGQLDVDKAAENIRGNIFFRGPNVWILAFSIIIASVGLNVNSTAVIIGAMLISPVMGPIIGMGLGLGVNDTRLLGDSFRNLLIILPSLPPVRLHPSTTCSSPSSAVSQAYWSRPARTRAP